MNALGDKHNFGRAVERNGNRIYKPRTIHWEYLFLSPESDLRKKLKELHRHARIADPFTLAPSLKFFESSKFGGSLEFLELTEETLAVNDVKRCSGEIGSLLALCLWFGLGDLHTENMAVGISHGRPVLFPLDIECVFDDLTHVSQTLLLPSNKVPVEKCGFSKVWESIISLSKHEKIHMVESFVRTINLYNLNSETLLEQIFHDQKTWDHPIRVIINDTAKYREAPEELKSKEFYDSELVQIQRGDIPYFFRFARGSEIYYYSEEDCPEDSQISIRELKIPKPISLHDQSKSHAKLGTAILSATSIARKLGFTTSNTQLYSINLSIDKTEIEISVDDKNINFSRL